MTEGTVLERDDIINHLVDELKPLDFVYACWEGGSAAFQRVDQWSDIDLYMVMDDGRLDDTVKIVEDALRALSPIGTRYESVHPQWPDLKHVFYRLEKTSEYLLVDIAYLKMSNPEKFLEREVHGDAVFLFNKEEIIKVPSVDKEVLRDKIAKGLEKMKARLEISDNFVQKEIFRRNPIDALGLYQMLILAPLVETLRIRHYPHHHDFGYRYLYHELPKDVVQRLEALFFIKDLDDLQAKFDEARAWLRGLLSEMGPTEVKL